MSGLQLAAGGFGRASAFTGARGTMPTAANQPTGTTINQAAFGIRNGTDGCGPATAGFGTAAAGVGAALVLAWLWWSLPR